MVHGLPENKSEQLARSYDEGHSGRQGGLSPLLAGSHGGLARVHTKNLSGAPFPRSKQTLG